MFQKQKEKYLFILIMSKINQQKLLNSGQRLNKVGKSNKMQMADLSSILALCVVPQTFQELAHSKEHSQE